MKAVFCILTCCTTFHSTRSLPVQASLPSSEFPTFRGGCLCTTRARSAGVTCLGPLLSLKKGVFPLSALNYSTTCTANLGDIGYTDSLKLLNFHKRSHTSIAGEQRQESSSMPSEAGKPQRGCVAVAHTL